MRLVLAYVVLVPVVLIVEVLFLAGVVQIYEHLKEVVVLALDLVGLVRK